MPIFAVSFNYNLIGVVPTNYNDIQKMTWDNKHFRTDIVISLVRTMGFDTIMEYVKCIPGCSKKEETPRTFFDGRAGGSYEITIPDSENKFIIHLQRIARGEKNEFKDGSRYNTEIEGMNRILKNGYEENCEFMFIPKSRLSMIQRKREFKELGNEFFWYFDNWKDTDDDDTIDKEILTEMDHSMDNLKKGIVSPEINLSDFEEES